MYKPGQATVDLRSNRNVGKVPLDVISTEMAHAGVKDRTAIKACVCVNKAQDKADCLFYIAPHKVPVPFRIMRGDLNYFRLTSATPVSKDSGQCIKVVRLRWS